MKNRAEIAEKGLLHIKGMTKGSRNLVFAALLLINFQFIAACGVAETSANDRRRKNETALLEAKENIAKFRLGRAVIKVVDERGNPAPNVGLVVRQVSHAFKFGCYLKIDDLDPAKLPAYERLFKNLFNYAVIGNYWANIETKKGDENWLWFDREVELGRKLGFETAAAPILWGTSEFGTPGWLPGQKSDLSPILERRVKSSVSRNVGVTDIEVVNEPLAQKKDFFAHVAGEGYILSALKWARDAGPGKRLMINEYGVFGSLPKHNYNRDRYFDLLKHLLSKGAQIDVIGIQAHANGEWFSPANVAEQLARYSEFGRPLQVTEFSVQTFDYDDRTLPVKISGTYQKGVWDAEKQARFYREFYTIAFGNPRVEAVVTWGLDDERAWLPGIGLIDRTGQPKPVYRELDRLINNEWKTRLEGKSDANGDFTFSGFFGDYEITATKGRTQRTKSTLAKGAMNEWVVHLGS